MLAELIKDYDTPVDPFRGTPWENVACIRHPQEKNRKAALMVSTLLENWGYDVAKQGYALIVDGVTSVVKLSTTPDTIAKWTFRDRNFDQAFLVHFSPVLGEHLWCVPVKYLPRRKSGLDTHNVCLDPIPEWLAKYEVIDES